MKRLLSVFLIFIFLLNSSMIATATETAVPPTSEAAPAMGDGTEEELENGITPWITPSTSYIPAREPIDDGYMTVDEGVYYIKYNAENLYMSVSGSTGSNNSSFYLDSKSSPGLYQLWKLAYWGNGYYSIHPLNRINSAIAYVGGLFLGDSGAPEEVSEMSDAFLWEISYADEYFTIRNYACITTGLGVTGTRVHNDSSAESWTLEEPTTVPEGWFSTTPMIIL